MFIVKDLPAYLTLAVTVVASFFGFQWMQPNDGPARFKNDVITVNAVSLQQWGVDPGELRQWGTPLEFVTDADADVLFKIGPTRSTDVPGYGKLYVAGEAKKTMDSKRWYTNCTVTLNDRGAPELKSATAIAVHEFGHCLGARHDDTRDSIMGTVMPSDHFQPEHWSWTVTDADRASVTAIYSPSE